MTTESAHTHPVPCPRHIQRRMIRNLHRAAYEEWLNSDRAAAAREILEALDTKAKAAVTARSAARERRPRREATPPTTNSARRKNRFMKWLIRPYKHCAAGCKQAFLRFFGKKTRCA